MFICTHRESFWLWQAGDFCGTARLEEHGELYVGDLVTSTFVQDCGEYDAGEEWGGVICGV